MEPGDPTPEHQGDALQVLPTQYQLLGMMAKWASISLGSPDSRAVLHSSLDIALK